MNNAEIVGLPTPTLQIPMVVRRSPSYAVMALTSSTPTAIATSTSFAVRGDQSRPWHPRVVRAIKDQAEKVTHVSNVFHTEPMARLAARLGGAFGDGRIFFGNSGAEANEAALKLARRWGHGNGGRFEFISTLGSFHGRTIGTLSATGQEKYHIGFQPLVPGFKLVPYDDVAAASVH